MAEEGPHHAQSPKQGAEEDCSVCVAVHIRPLIDLELTEGCQNCLTVSADQPQVLTGTNSFTYDHVFGGGGQAEAGLYDSCVLPLVEGLFKGYNATVFAYGQTGSGKTYTMGSAFTPGGVGKGVIPKVMDTIFAKIDSSQGTDFTVRVGFVEIHTEEIRDLLVFNSQGSQAVHIRELPGGGICLAGATEKEVASKAQMAELLSQGTLQRATASTNMNKHSSRSHAIFTITVEQRRKLPMRTGMETEDDGNDSGDDDVDDYLCAKMHLVDLAGSERTKRTKAEGQRLKEGININKGLLALGNVISSLSEGKSHVPYRDSKLTRMLQDSLGGNSRTVMIACVSPADVNLEESLNTLRYANRARNIKNKPVVNRDPNAAQLAHLRQQLTAARSEITMLKKRLAAAGSDGGNPWVDPNAVETDRVMTEALDEMQLKYSKLDLENARLRVELETVRQEVNEVSQKLMEAEMQRDTQALKAEQNLEGVSHNEIDGQQLGVMQRQLQRIADLEQQVKRLKKVQRASGAFMMSTRKQGGGGTPSHSQDANADPVSPFHVGDLARSLASDLDAAAINDVASSLAEDEEFAAEEHAHRLEQQKAASELEQLQRVLESKEAQMSRIISGDGQIATLKKHYDRLLTELQSERDELQKERVDLLQRMQSLRSAKVEDRTALEAKYRQRLKEMDEKLKGVGQRERKYAHVERLQARSQETCQRLQSDIQTIKQQKVQLVRNMEKSQKDFQQWRKQREREVLALKRQGMKAAAHVQRLEALQAKQQAVLRRKTEEADAARKRLKEMVEVHQRASEVRSHRLPKSNGVEAQPNNTAPLLRDEKSRREWVEHELDMCCQSFEVQRVLDGEKAERAETARQLHDVTRRLAAAPSGTQAESLTAKQTELQEHLNQQSTQILETQQQLMRAKADEDQKGHAASDARRWNGLKTIVEARSLLKSVFKVAANQKAQLYEGQSELAEAREEAEMLRLKLEAAEQEVAEAKKATASAQSALAEALVVQATLTPRPLELQQSTPDEVEGLVNSLMEDISDAQQSTMDAPLNTSDGISQESEGALVEPEDADYAEYASAPESEVSDEEVDEEDEEEDLDDVWDPKNATPWRSRGRRRSSGGRPTSSHQSSREGGEIDEAQKAMRDEVEHPVLMDINHDRSRQGHSPVVKLTVLVLRNHLRGKVVHGREWRMGTKKREDLIEDYRAYLSNKGREKGKSLLRASPASSSNDSFTLVENMPERRNNHDYNPRSRGAVTARQPMFDDLDPNSDREGPGLPTQLSRLSRPADLPLSARLPGRGYPYQGRPSSSQDARDPGTILTPLTALHKVRTRAPADSNSDIGSPGVGTQSSDEQEGTPTAKLYGEVRQACHDACKRVQALKARMDHSALPTEQHRRQPITMPPLLLPTLKLPSDGGQALPSHPDSPGDPQQAHASTNHLDDSCADSPTRHILGDIANAGEVTSPTSKRAYDKSFEAQTARNRRNHQGMRSGGPLSSRTQRSNLVSPRPRAAWL